MSLTCLFFLIFIFIIRQRGVEQLRSKKSILLFFFPASTSITSVKLLTSASSHCSKLHRKRWRASPLCLHTPSFETESKRRGIRTFIKKKEGKLILAFFFFICDWGCFFVIVVDSLALWGTFIYPYKLPLLLLPLSMTTAMTLPPFPLWELGSQQPHLAG